MEESTEICGPFTFQLQANGELVFLHLGKLASNIGGDAFLIQFLVDVMLQVCLLEVAAHGGFVGLLGHQLAVDLHLQIGVIGFRGFEQIFGVQQIALRFRIAHFQNDGVGLHQMSGANYDFVHARGGLRRNPVNVFRHQGAQAAHLAEHRSTLHGVRPDGGGVDGGRRRLQASTMPG